MYIYIKYIYNMSGCATRLAKSKQPMSNITKIGEAKHPKHKGIATTICAVPMKNSRESINWRKHKHDKHHLDATSHRLPRHSPPPRTHTSLKRIDIHNSEPKTLVFTVNFSECFGKHKKHKLFDDFWLLNAWKKKLCSQMVARCTEATPPITHHHNRNKSNNNNNTNSNNNSSSNNSNNNNSIRASGRYSREHQQPLWHCRCAKPYYIYIYLFIFIFIFKFI